MDERTRSQLMFGNRSHHHHRQPIVGSPTFDCFPENVDHNLPILRYLSPPSSSSVVVSPLSAVENLMERSPQSVLYGTPVKAMEGEEVLVMDAVLVRGGGGRSNEWGSSSASSSSSGSSGKSRYKTGICHAWEDYGKCRHSSKCQFAHGKEELRPHRLTIKNKTEIVASPMVTKLAKSITKTSSPVTLKDTSKALTTSKEWSPQDDGIEVILPSFPTEMPLRKKVNAYIDRILAGPTTTSRRLPVFVEFCPS